MIKEIRSKFDMKTINLIHVFITGTLLACIGYKKDSTPKWKFYALGFMALMIPVLVYLPKKFSLQYWTTIQIAHYLIIMPGLLYIAYKQKFSDQIYDSICALGIGIAGYHGYKYYIRLNKK